MFKKILVPTDGSPLAEYAGRVAMEAARNWGSELVVLSVAQPPAPLVSGEASFGMDMERETQQLHELADQHASRIVLRAKAEGVLATPVTAIAALPYLQILHAAQEQHCDVIFMASHGRRGLSRLIAGSQTQHVLAEAQVPVLVLRPTETELTRHPTVEPVHPATDFRPHA
jgi:nucleotide-binding universal stress UspA family protein